MPRDRDHVRLVHMLEHAEEAIRLVKGRAQSELDSERVLSLALVRLLEIVGEAAAKVSPEARTRFPAIPWPEIVGLRNRLIHGYDSVDFDILWRIIETDLPALVHELSADRDLRGAR